MGIYHQQSGAVVDKAADVVGIGFAVVGDKLMDHIGALLSSSNRILWNICARQTYS